MIGTEFGTGIGHRSYVVAVHIDNYYTPDLSIVYYVLF